MLIVDSHLDLAYNAQIKGRDLRLELADLRAADNVPDNTPTVTIPAMQKGGVALAFATIFTTPTKASWPGNMDGKTYDTVDQAHAMGQDQIDYYRRLADEVETVRLVENRAEMEAVLEAQEQESDRPLGLVLLMEGADPIREPQEAEWWYEQGVRLVGPAWDATAYCGSSMRDDRDGLTPAGRELLEVMAGLGMILDVTHMNDRSVNQSLDAYEGTIVATHSNARALVPMPRQLSDDHIRAIGERSGMIGIVLCNTFLVPDYRKAVERHRVGMDQVVAHIDHMCQLLGDASHVGIGSDLDGGFGRENIPTGMDSIADLSLIGDALLEKGYTDDDVAGIMGLNWINLLRTVWLD